jgi:hypothetical protein
MAFKRDYEFGIKSQIDVFPILSTFFGGNITPTTNKMDPWDFVGDDNVYELKSRCVTYSKYPTTIVGLDKIKDIAKKIVFLFKFTDGLYYIRYDKALFDTFTVEAFRRYRVGVNDKEKAYIYIPTEHLKRIE